MFIQISGNCCVRRESIISTRFENIDNGESWAVIFDLQSVHREFTHKVRFETEAQAESHFDAIIAELRHADVSPGQPSEDQASIARWAIETFPGGDPATPADALRLLEEATELCVASGATSGECMAAMTRGLTPDQVHDPSLVRAHPEGVSEEAADCGILLTVLAGRRGIDLQAEVDSKMKKNRARRWEPNGDGTGRHVKEPA